MIVEETTIKVHVCDICGKRLPQTSIKKCYKCNKELCTYDRLRLTTTERKHPDSGYSLLQKGMGYLCFKCAGVELKKSAEII